MSNLSYTLTDKSLTVINNYKDVYTTTSDNPNWNSILDALRNGDDETVIKMVTIKNSIESFSVGSITVKNDCVFYKNTQLHGTDVERLLGFIKQNLPSNPLIKFLENKMLNPSKQSIDELYKFLEHKNLPLTPDGSFLAYKGVTPDFYSITSGKITLIQGKSNDSGQIFNGINETIEVPRNEVDDNRNNGCSQGLHVGSLAYASGFAGGTGKVLIVEVYPKDVVSVPVDCSYQKLRTCKYKVVGEYTGPLPDVYTNSYSTQLDDDCDDYEFVDGDNLDDDDWNENKSENINDYEDGYNAGYLDYKDVNQYRLAKEDCTSTSSKYRSGYQNGWTKAKHEKSLGKKTEEV